MGAKSSDNVVEETWLAFAMRREPDPGTVEEALARVGGHYRGLVTERLERTESLGRASGLVLWQRPDDRLRWPLATRGGAVHTAATAVPTGWDRVVGERAPESAARELAAALDARPELASELNAPFVIGIRNESENRIRIVNDSLGIGRLYELETDEGWVWSNRLGALPIFAGVPVEPDRRGWEVFAAAGWFLGDSTPIAGARKVPAGTVIEVREDGDGAGVTHEATESRERSLVSPRDRPGDAAVEAATQVSGLAADLGEVWETSPVIDLSGGRDSRVSAAGALHAGLAASFKTVDNEPGEVDVVRRLVAAFPGELSHVVNQPEAEEAADDLASRLAAIHLVHDGMRNPQEVRRPTELPHSGLVPPSMSGHGGEIGHGFYYANRRAVWRLSRGGYEGLLERLMVAARRRHSAATGDAYAAYAEECRRVLGRGREAGLWGPSLLDYFYLAERLPYRSGLGARSGRYSACVVPAFVRAAFDLKPAERLRAKLHSEVVARLVPEWEDIPYFVSGSGRLPATRRARIWEKPEHAAEIDEMIEAERGWPEIFDPDRIRRMWAEVREGGGSADYEHVFYRLVWRAGYEDHLERLNRAARGVPAETPAKAAG
jgi:hypothetical protein